MSFQRLHHLPRRCYGHITRRNGWRASCMAAFPIVNQNYSLSKQYSTAFNSFISKDEMIKEIDSDLNDKIDNNLNCHINNNYESNKINAKINHIKVSCSESSKQALTQPILSYYCFNPTQRHCRFNNNNNYYYYNHFSSQRLATFQTYQQNRLFCAKIKQMHPNSVQTQQTRSQNSNTNNTNENSNENTNSSQTNTNSNETTTTAAASTSATATTNNNNNNNNQNKAVTPKNQVGQGQSSMTKYLNPIYIIKRVGTFVYNFLYALFDSIIHPTRGKERLARMWTSIKNEAKHLWDGSKLLWADVKQATKIIRKLLRGTELTYRERRQLRRTALDLLRMIPFAFFIMIPFAEALLPVALILFPNMLPSRFQNELKKQEDRKKQLQLRLNMAQFLETTLEQFSNDLKQRQSVSNDETQRLDVFLNKLRDNEDVTNDQILKVATLFDDHITLDNAEATQLANMCRYMGLNPFGLPAMLRIRLYSRIRELRREDRGIRREGVENVPLPLLKQLLRERGMRADFEEAILRKNMSRWLELSLDHHVPVTLLIVSRIFTLEHSPYAAETDMLKEALGTVSDAAVEEVLVERAGVADPEIEKKVLDRKAKLIQDENELIEKEQKQAKKVSNIDRPSDALASPTTEIDQEERRKKMLYFATALETLASDSGVANETDQLKAIKQRLLQLVDNKDESEMGKELSQVSEKMVKILQDSQETELKQMGSIAAKGDKSFDTMTQYAAERSEKIKTTEKVKKEDLLQKELDEAGGPTEDIKKAFFEESERKAAELEATQQQQPQSTEAPTFAKEIDTQNKLQNKIASMIQSIEKRIEVSDQTIADTMKKIPDDENMSFEEVKQAVLENLKSHSGMSDEIDALLQNLDLKKDGKLDKAELVEVIKSVRDEFQFDEDLEESMMGDSQTIETVDDATDNPTDNSTNNPTDASSNK